MFLFFMNPGRCREFRRWFNNRSWRCIIETTPEMCIRFQVGGSSGKPSSKPDSASVKWASRSMILVKKNYLYCIYICLFLYPLNESDILIRIFTILLKNCTTVSNQNCLQAGERTCRQSACLNFMDWR